MGLFSKPKLGFKPLTGSPAEQIIVKEKNGYIYSKFLNYKFKIPENGKVTYYTYPNSWEDNVEQIEFNVRFADTCSIQVSIAYTAVAEKDRAFMENEADYSKLLRMVFDRAFGFKGNDVTDEKFIGRDFVHGTGISNKLHNGRVVYINEYSYGSPYARINFFGICDPSETHILNKAMLGFKK